MNRQESFDNIWVKGGESLTTEEFENLLDIHGNDIYRFCLHIMRSSENADDLYQDTVLTAFRKADMLDISENPKSYLLSVAVKLSHNFFRKERRKNEKIIMSADETLNNLPDNADIQTTTEETALKTALRKAVAELNEKYRIPVVLYYFDEQNISFISEVMKIPEGTVKSRLHKARELIAETLRKGGFDYE